jgi:hypothetical protein
MGITELVYSLPEEKFRQIKKGDAPSAHMP